MFQSFPLKDPNLPISLLTEAWIGIRGRELFDNYHRLLGAQANQYVDEVISGEHEKEAV
jgi:DNA-binding transcriptional regulator PaaX